MTAPSTQCAAVMSTYRHQPCDATIPGSGAADSSREIAMTTLKTTTWPSVMV